MIQDAQDAHSGVYTCSPTNAIVGKIRVHVLNGMFFELKKIGDVLLEKLLINYTIYVGEHPEAMYSSCYLAKHSLHQFSLFCQLYILMYFVLSK